MKKIKDDIYVVKNGDTLASIAKAYNVNPTFILLANNLTPKMICEGTVLYIQH